MRIVLLLLISLLFLTGCGKKEEPSSQQSTSEKTNTGTEIQTAQDTLKKLGEAVDKSTSGGIVMHKFDKRSLPVSIKYKGEIVDGASWTDSYGDNLLIITQTDVKHVNADEREQYIYAYQFVNREDSYSQLWSITDFVRSYCDVDARYYPGTLEIKDVDGDGIAEDVFCYEIDGRCDVSPLDVKLMMHSGDKKLVIRGTIGFDPQDGHKTKGEKNFDAAFKDVPSSLKDYASDKWDEFVEKYKKE